MCAEFRIYQLCVVCLLVEEQYLKETGCYCVCCHSGGVVAVTLVIKGLFCLVESSNICFYSVDGLWCKCLQRERKVNSRRCFLSGRGNDWRRVAHSLWNLLTLTNILLV